MEIKWFFSKREGQGQSRQKSKYLYFLAGSPNTIQKIKMGSWKEAKSLRPTAILVVGCVQGMSSSVCSLSQLFNVLKVEMRQLFDSH